VVFDPSPIFAPNFASGSVFGTGQFGVYDADLRDFDRVGPRTNLVCLLITTEIIMKDIIRNY
jgi:hypothetical protein